MITNIKVNLTDEERVVLQRALTGKQKAVSRKQVTEFVTGSVDALLRTQHAVDAAPAVEVEPVTGNDFSFYRQTHDDPALEGKSQSYIVGYNRVKFRTVK